MKVERIKLKLMNKYLYKACDQTQLVQYNIAQCSLFSKAQLYTTEMVAIE